MQMKAALTATEEAYLAMVQQEHAQLIRTADARREERMKPLFQDKGIPPGIPVNAEARTADTPAYLIYDGPDIAPAEGPSSGGTAEAGL